MTHATPAFERLEDVSDKVVTDFIPLLEQLSTSFASKDEEAKYLDTAANLVRALEAPGETAIFVHRDQDTIVSAATANLTFTPDAVGWVDDVVSLETVRGRGLGRTAMEVLHGWLVEKGAQRVRLTSAYGRAAAGNLYTSMGYQEGGQVWRANTPTAIDQDPGFDPLSRLVISHSVESDRVIGKVHVNDCSIPTGHKAWLDGLFAADDDVDTYASMMLGAHLFLAGRGAATANVITDASTSPNLLSALELKGYKQRETRLYTLDLAQVA